MKQKLLFAAALLVCCLQSTLAQNGYIYIHQKTLNEQASADFSYTITGPSSFSQTFALNNSPAYIQNGDMGAGHGTTASGNGDGELWVIASTAVASYNVSPVGLTGGIYRRPSGNSNWAATAVTTGVLAIDGAYYNECVYVTSGGAAYFYYNGTSTQIYTGTDATDITASGGNIAIVSGGKIKVYNKQYVAGASINTTNGAWTTLTVTGLNTTTATRLDLNLAGTSILSSYVTGTTEYVYTTGITVSGGTGTTAGTITPGATATATTFTATTDAYGNSVSGAAGNPDVAYDDKGYIYAIAKSPIYNAGDIVYSNTSGSYVYEPQSRAVERITAASGGQAWGAVGKGTTNSIWTRCTDGTHIWIDDERVRVNGVGTAFKTGGGTGTGNTNTGVGVANGNAIMIPVTPGTYVVTETLPDATWDLGRYTTYVPSTSSITTSVSTQQVTITVAANDVVHVEYFNEKLSPKAIALTCTTSVLEDFGTGTNTFGDTTEGTAYHYYPQGIPQDGEYYIVQSLSNWFITSPALQSHTNPGTGYYLVVNASYALDEFFRKRVTNLVPGLSYTISFYAANINYTTGTTNIRIPPNVLYGLQDANGNIVQSQSTGSIDSLGAFNTDGSIKWELYSFTFTATTSQADLFFRNNTIGGLGNDIALDDISLNPVITPLTSNVITPTVAPNLCVGARYTFSNIATAANPTAQYSWASSNTSIATINAVTGKANTLAAGSVIITYTLTNTIGCVSTATSSLTAVAPPTATTSDKFGGVLCQGSKDSLFAVVTGAVTPSYTWSQSATGGGLNGGTGTASTLNTTATPTVGGTSYTYTFVVSDAVTGCSASSSVTVAVSSNVAPTVTAASSKTLVCYGTTTALTATASGTGPYTFTWTGSGTITPNGNAAAASATATPTASGIYTVVVDDGQGCQTFATTATVTADAQITASATPSLTDVCLTQPITVTANASGGNGTYNYAWIGTPNGTSTGGGITAGATTATITAIPSNALGGASGNVTYTVTVTDGNGCVATSGSPNVVVNSHSNTAPTVSATVSATTACNGQTTLTLTATRSGGATGTDTYTWSGNGTFTGTNPYTKPSTTTVSTLSVKPTASGAYTVQVSDPNGCSASATTSSVTVNALPSVTATATPPTNLCSGSGIPLTATATGGSGTYSSYTWSTVTTPNLTTISAYTPNGTSAANNSIATVTIGSVSLNTQYQFAVTVTDGNGCTATANTPAYTITYNFLATAPTLSSTTATPATTNICATETAITLKTTRAGGTGTGTYTWSGVASTYSGTGNPYTNATTSVTTSTTATPSAAGSGIYTVTLKDANGCTATANTTAVTVYGVPTVTAASNYNLLCLSTTSPLSLTLTSTATPAGSATISTYAWTASPSTGAGLGTTTTQNTTATPTTAGSYTYSMKATDNLGCYASASTGSVVAAATPVVTATATPPATLCAGNNITLAANITTATTGPYVYGWSYPTISVVTPSTGTITGTSISGTATTDTAGTYVYTVSVTDANGCSAVGNTGTAITIGQISPNISYTCGNTNGTSGIEYVQFNESNGSSWAWTTSSGGRFYTSSALSTSSDATTSTLQAPFVTFLGTYTVSIVTSAGCTGTGSYTLTSSSCSIILAVSNLNFTAVKQGNEALLEWSTATEANNNYFNVERSSDGVTWQTVGTIKAVGNSSTLSNYSFTDALPLNGINYYRLKQVDDNGQYSYSPVRSLQFTGQWLVKLYPNPVQNFIVLEFNNDRDEKGIIAIKSVSGATVFTTEQQLVKGLNLINLNQVQRMAQGTYIITLQTNENIFRSKFVKGGD